MKARLCPGVYRFLPIDDQHPKFARYKKGPGLAGAKALLLGKKD
jgi:hypothetical protein